jgi:hypothetical protein
MNRLEILLKKAKSYLTWKSPKYKAMVTDSKKLVIIANKVLFYLLTTEKLTKHQSNLIVKMCNNLHDNYTRDSGSDSSDYSKKFSENTVDYKIARELTLRFTHMLSYDTLANWANHYYYDGLLWSHALQRMIELDPIPGLVYAIKHTQVDHWNTNEDVRRENFWTRLTTAFNPTWDQIEGIVINSTMPIDLVKTMFGYVFEKKLLNDHPSEKYYSYLWEHTFKNVEDYKKHFELTEKHEIELSKLARAGKQK